MRLSSIDVTVKSPEEQTHRHLAEYILSRYNKK